MVSSRLFLGAENFFSSIKNIFDITEVFDRLNAFALFESFD
jgi:hypothetical protein